MGWSYDDLMALPPDVYVEAVAFVNALAQP